jgi:hypothetical protein
MHPSGHSVVMELTAPRAIRVVLAVAVVSALVGCATDDGATTGSVRGTLRMVGGPAPGVNRRISGTIKIVGGSGDTWTIHASRTADFVAHLSAGTYRISGRSPLINDGHSDCGVVTVSVRADRTSHDDVICDIM